MGDKMTLRYAINFTSKDGSEAEIIGHPMAIDVIERAFKRAGIRFNENVECWDEGYYELKPQQTHRGMRGIE